MHVVFEDINLVLLFLRTNKRIICWWFYWLKPPDEIEHMLNYYAPDDELKSERISVAVIFYWLSYLLILAM